MRLSKSVVAGPRAAIWTTALFAEAVRPTIVVSTKLKSGSLSHIRMVVAVKTPSFLYEGKRPPSPEASAVVFSSSLSLLVSTLKSFLDVSFVSFVVPIMSSEAVYKGGKSVVFDLVFVVLNIDILSEGEEMHLVGGNCDDLNVEKGDSANACD